ncbi:MAG: hypothetical protein IPJ69_11150 [Deltaproteobacteria bacterium]|nr:MAG: hypothetical protein IPJ69_11150 [Deltaproteobacteria bacterium]
MNTQVLSIFRSSVLAFALTNCTEKTGAPGSSGSSCTINDGYLRCPDGTSFNLNNLRGDRGENGRNGINGTDGRNGTSCTVRPDYRLACTDGTSVDVTPRQGERGLPGSNGINGSSCSTGVDGYVRCTDGTSMYAVGPRGLQGDRGSMGLPGSRGPGIDTTRCRTLRGEVRHETGDPVDAMLILNCNPGEVVWHAGFDATYFQAGSQYSSRVVSRPCINDRSNSSALPCNGISPSESFMRSWTFYYMARFYDSGFTGPAGTVGSLYGMIICCPTS